MNKEVYKFHNLVRLVRGVKSSVILDLHRINWYRIPNSMHDFIVQNEFQNINKCIQSILIKEDKAVVKEYYQFLKAHELIFELQKNELKFFPVVTPIYDVPELITNILIHFGKTSLESIRIVFGEIEKMGCKHYQIKLDFLVKKEHLKIIESIFYKTDVLSVNILIKELDTIIKENDLKEFTEDFGRIKSLFIYNSKKSKLIRSNTDMNNIVYLKSSINRVKNCVSRDDFVINPLSYSESLEFNLYFNRKLYIGENGEIKNAPECEETFGNINDLKNVDELKQIIATPEFQKYWYIHKELCDVCKDCEFRHMCVDSRLPSQREDKSWYHKTECNYNPYICKWEGEEGYQTLEECGVISNEKGFSIDHEKIAAINKILWEEEKEDA